MSAKKYYVHGEWGGTCVPRKYEAGHVGFGTASLKEPRDLPDLSAPEDLVSESFR